MDKYKTYSVKIDRKEAMRYLGFGPNTELSAHDPVLNKIEAVAAVVENASKPAYIYRVFDITYTDDCAVHLKDTDFTLTGRDISGILSGCGRCILLAATVGIGLDMLIRRAQVSSMAEAVIFDSCASCAVENLCGQLCEDIEKELESKNLFLTDRFSPGYGDLPLSLQPKLCSLLDTEKRIGLSAAAGDLMVPTKSITAVMGISDVPQKKIITGCSACRLSDVCSIRKAGNKCGQTKETEL